jgi:hypothetical protein
MNRSILSSLPFLVLVSACGAPSSPGGVSASEPPVTSDPAKTHEALSFVAPCSSTACGEVPESLGDQAKPACAPQGTSCVWSAGGGDDTSVSYRECAETECSGDAPAEDVCPAGTTFAGNRCGSENDAACAWTTACVAPRSTTPCGGGADACGPKPEIGVICADGTTGDLVCVEANGGCEYQRSCD